MEGREAKERLLTLRWRWATVDEAEAEEVEVECAEEAEDGGVAKPMARSSDSSETSISESESSEIDTEPEFVANETVAFWRVNV